MTNTRAAIARRASVGLATIVCFNIAAYQIVSGVEKACANRSCVYFYQWRTAGSGGAYHAREACGSELWAYLDGCCHPDLDAYWCGDEIAVLDMGSSTRKVNQYGISGCTLASCASEKTQPYSSNMFVEYVNATRYACYNPEEE